MFDSGGLLAADTVWREALGLGKQVRYLASSQVNEGSSAGVSKSIS